MAKQTSFRVSRKGVEPVEVDWDAPESLDDPRWAEVVSNPNEDINELAVQNLIIKIQSGARNRLDEGEAAVQEFVNIYKYGTRQPGAVRKAPVIGRDAIERGGFTEEQMALLRAAGVVFETDEAEIETETEEEEELAEV